MATILIAWELGGGLGHLTPLVPIVRTLRDRGHRIFAVVRDLSQVRQVFSGLDLTCLQAPVKISKSADKIDPVRSFAHILHNCGFSDADELYSMAEGWRLLYEFVSPDLILFDHAPTALLASRACPARRAVIGTGFCCPPDVSPLPDFRSWLPDASAQLRRDEEHVLANANHVLTLWGQNPLKQLSHLYRDVDHAFVTTFPELDHYPNRGPAEYYGTWPTRGGARPEWPDVRGKRIFAYLKPFRKLPELLAAVQQSGCPALIYINNIRPDLRSRFESPALRFATKRLDVQAVSATCDLAILNGGHNVTVIMLLSGRPIIQLPLNLEQTYNGSAVARLKAGAMPKNSEGFAPVLKTAIDSDRYADGARRFAARYADFDFDQQIQRVCHQLHKLATEN